MKAEMKPETRPTIAVLRTDLLRLVIGPRGGEKVQCECGWHVYKTDRNWTFKACEHLNQHGAVALVGAADPQEQPKPKPQLRRVK